jgi:hypothetical protein
MTRPERYIVAGVANDRGIPAGRAGSSPRGYDGITAYGTSARAQKIMQSVEADYGLREVTAWPIEPLHMHCAVLELPASADRAAMLDVLSRDKRLTLAQPLQTFATRTESYNDPYVGLQRGFREMDVADAHPWSRGEGVRVAIIDTGADTGHLDLRGAIAATENFVDGDEGQFRRDRHGTEIAGIIAAVANNREGIVGVAPGARLYVYKACWQLQPAADAARCNSFTLARALAAALEARSQVVNLSLAGPEDPLLDGLIAEGIRRGMVFVGAASAGVRGDAGLVHQRGILAVASAESPGSDRTVLYAPGRDILTLLPGGHYDFASGNSLATAHVTGAVALLLAKNSALSASELQALLQHTSAHTMPVGDPGNSVDACGAVTTLIGRGSCKSAAGDGDGRVAAR